MTKNIGILGAGGQAREVAQYLRDAGVEVAFHAIDNKYFSGSLGEIDILKPSTDYRDTQVIAAVGAPGLRRDLVEKWQGKEYATLVSGEAYVGDDVVVGAGSVITPRAVLTANVQLGRHVFINVAATVSHDCIVGDFVTISPGAHIAGGVEIGDGVFVGIGAIIRDGVRIAPGSVVGAGAVVVKDVTQENSVVAGVPAGLLRTNEDWMDTF